MLKGLGPLKAKIRLSSDAVRNLFLILWANDIFEVVDAVCNPML